MIGRADYEYGGLAAGQEHIIWRLNENMSVVSWTVVSWTGTLYIGHLSLFAPSQPCILDQGFSCDSNQSRW